MNTESYRYSSPSLFPKNWELETCPFFSISIFSLWSWFCLQYINRLCFLPFENLCSYHEGPPVFFLCCKLNILKCFYFSLFDNMVMIMLTFFVLISMPSTAHQCWVSSRGHWHFSLIPTPIKVGESFPLFLLEIMWDRNSICSQQYPTIHTARTICLI